MSIKLLHGAHVPHRKNTADCTPKRMPVEAGTLLTIPVSMNIGAPSKAVVKVNDMVKVGQLIAEPGGFVSSPIYSGVSGKVKKLDEVLLFHGASCQAIVIEADGEQLARAVGKTGRVAAVAITDEQLCRLVCGTLEIGTH